MPASVGRLSLIAVALALGGSGLAWSVTGASMFSPGALHAGDSVVTPLGGIRAHRELEKECGACHGPPRRGHRRAMARRCLECHSDTRAELRDTTTMHGRLGDVSDCGACHTEHRGPAGELTRIEDIAHDRLGFSLAAHERTDAGDAFVCRDCHRADSYRFERERCGDCHREYQLEFVTRHTRDWGDACMDCHDGKDRFSRGVFDHATAKFRLDGAHADASCITCHTDTRTLVGFRDAPVECIGCHRDDDEHRGEFGADCGECHGVDTWEGARFEHEFPLDHGEEGTIACRTCHEDRENYKSYTCYGCHEHSPSRIRAEHAEEGITGAELADCARCHPTGEEDEGERRGRGGRRTEREREH